MIKGKLSDCQKYEACHPKFKACFARLAAIAKNFSAGEIDECGARFLCQSYFTKPAEEKKLEVHRKYIDIQFLAAGEEAIYFGNAADFSVKTPYDESKDAEFLEGSPNETLVLKSGEFAVFFPEDAHRAGCVFKSPREVQKVVVKVPIK
ncbi:MAG: YhcH/YjgK/YiaL family protein [Opitutales bacterium]|nr:YhcH/YjgK/YiaL family protein [Opitutales bacterium]